MTQPKLACPFCGEYESRVRETEASTLGVERWRKCLNLRCGKWFQTIETVRVITTTLTVTLKRPSHP